MTRATAPAAEIVLYIAYSNADRKGGVSNPELAANGALSTNICMGIKEEYDKARRGRAL
jgi:hypothetical protein